MWTLLLIVAIFLLLIFGGIGITFTYALALILWDYTLIERYHKGLAVSIDQLGNVLMAPLFNLILIDSYSGHLFGNPDETISSVLGKNKIGGNLLYLGKRLDAWLNGIDPNHSIKSIEKDETLKPE